MLWRVTALLISEVIAASPSEALANRSHRLGLKFKNELTRTIRRNGKYIDISLMKLVGCDNKTFRTHNLMKVCHGGTEVKGAGILLT